MYNVNHSRALHIDFESELNDDMYLQSEWISTAIDSLEDLNRALQVTLKSKDSRVFLRACHEAGPVIQKLKDGGLKRTASILKAHFKKEIKLDDLSFRRNAMRLQAIGTMLIQSLIGRGMAA